MAGTLLGIQALVPHMEAGSSIVNIGSVAASTAHYPVAYTSSKWVLQGSQRAPPWNWAHEAFALMQYIPASSKLQ